MLCYSRPQLPTHCGLAVLNLQKGYDPPFAKTRVSFTTSNTSDAENRRPAALPYAGCTPYSTGIETQPPQSSSHRTTQAPCLAPRRPVLAGFHPRWGNDPSQPGQGAVWATQGSVWQKEKKTAQPGKQPPAQTKNTPALGFPSGTRVPQKPAVVRGVKKEQVKGPGSLEASRAGSLRPAEPVVEGFFPGVNFPFFRGRFWGLGVTDGVRKAKFPGGKPFSRVSPPGSTKG